MAGIKRFEGMDGDDPATYVSPTPETDAYHLRMIVGPHDSPGEEFFDVLVCTPLWLASEIDKHGPQIGRHHLVVGHLDMPKAIAFLRERIEHRTSASTWHELAEKIGRIGLWEFEDYRP